MPSDRSAVVRARSQAGPKACSDMADEVAVPDGGTQPNASRRGMGDNSRRFFDIEIIKGKIPFSSIIDDLKKKKLISDKCEAIVELFQRDDGRLVTEFNDKQMILITAEEFEKAKSAINRKKRPERHVPRPDLPKSATVNKAGLGITCRIPLRLFNEIEKHRPKDTRMSEFVVQEVMPFIERGHDLRSVTFESQRGNTKKINVNFRHEFEKCVNASVKRSGLSKSDWLKAALFSRFPELRYPSLAAE